MPALTLLILFAAGAAGPPPAPAAGPASAPVWLVARVLHTYEARIRVGSRVSTTRVQASDAGHAKRLVQAQFGDTATVLSVKRVK